MFGGVKEAWSSGAGHEVSWWTDHLRNELKSDPTFLPRARGEWPFEFAKFLPSGCKAANVLDVGAGPLSQVGTVHETIAVSLTAVDPLANAYSSVLNELGIAPSIATEYGEAERLDEKFMANQFDFAYCRNALDHSYHSLEGIFQIIRVMKPGATF